MHTIRHTHVYIQPCTQVYTYKQAHTCMHTIRHAYVCIQTGTHMYTDSSGGSDHGCRQDPGLPCSVVRWPRGGDLAPFLDSERPRVTGRRHWLPGCWERDGRGQRSTGAREGKEDLLRGGVGPGRTGSPQFPGAGRAQGVQEPPTPHRWGLPQTPAQSHLSSASPLSP